MFDALKMVLEALGKTNQVSEEVESIMGGVVMEFSADKYYDAGRVDGEEKLGRLMYAMKEAGKEKEAFQAATDREFREKMYVEYKIDD